MSGPSDPPPPPPPLQWKDERLERGVRLLLDSADLRKNYGKSNLWDQWDSRATVPPGSRSFVVPTGLGFQPNPSNGNPVKARSGLHTGVCLPLQASTQGRTQATNFILLRDVGYAA